MRFLPREEKFYNYFNSQASLIQQSARLLLEACEGTGRSWEQIVPEISELEHKGDEIIHEIFVKLNATFITPIDPEDIHNLASHLDDVLDLIEEAVVRAHLYVLTTVPPTLVEMARLIVACSDALVLAFEAVERKTTVLNQCIEINRLEEQADRLERQAIGDLFKNEKDPIELIKRKEIYELLERVTDACEDVADVLQNVVVKNS